MSKRISFIAVLALTLTLSACQSIGPLLPSQEDSEAAQMARIAEQAHDYQSAARQYMALAKSSYGAERSQFYLKAANAYWLDEQLIAAEQTYALVDKNQLNPTLLLKADLLESQFKINQANPDQALELLSTYRLEELNSSQQKELLDARITAYQLNENWLEKANSHILLADSLPPSKQEENQQALWQALMKLTPQALDLFNPGIPPSVDSGWFSLAYIIKTYQSNPATLTVALEDWHRNYPNHPAMPEVYKATLSTGTLLPQQLNTIAVLLPETGPYSEAAEAIKQGIFAAHFSSGSTSQLHFIDVRTDPISGLTNVWQAYQQAINFNADIVIGPLGKESIEELANGNNLPIPVLALNRLPEQRAQSNLYQFGLAPEDDARSIAELAKQQGLQRSLILFPEASWGKRIASSFTDQWLLNGGTVITQASYDESQNDFSTTLTSLLGLESSEHRYQLVKQVLGQSAEFEARPRQDIDFIFLIARPLKARQLVPQLKYHRSGDTPIFTTSHAYSGSENTQQDIDLNNTMLTDIPWMFTQNSIGNDPAYDTIFNNEVKTADPHTRLYALGVDAYRLTSQLNQMSRSPSLTMSGATGILSINPAGIVERRLTAGQFIDSKLQASQN
jgi:outer membrane PBP1 activator LpoA protein